MSILDEIPDRLSVYPESPYYNKAFLDKVPIIEFNGIVQKGTVVEYCISEGWVKRYIGRSVGRDGRRLTFKINGIVKVKI